MCEEKNEEKEEEGDEEEEVVVVVVEALECLSTSAFPPIAETRTLWEEACSGAFHAQPMKGEFRR